MFSNQITVPLPGDCSFDESQAIASCSWQQLSDDDFDWSVGSSTPTEGTGPTGERTGATRKFLDPHPGCVG